MDVLKEYPYCIAPTNKNYKSYCHHCLAPLVDCSTVVTCNVCKFVHYCSRDCKKKAYNDHYPSKECKLISTLDDPTVPDMIRLLLHTIQRHETINNADDFLFDNIVVDDKKREMLLEDVEAVDSFKYYADRIRHLDPDLLLISENDLFNIFCKLWCTRRPVYSMDGYNIIGSGVYLSLHNLKHSCCPKTTVRFEKDGQMIIRYVETDPETGEFYYNPNLLTYNYLNLFLMKYSERKKLLKKWFLIEECDCDLCQVERKETINFRCYEQCGKVLQNIGQDKWMCSCCKRKYSFNCDGICREYDNFINYIQEALSLNIEKLNNVEKLLIKFDEFKLYLNSYIMDTDIHYAMFLMLGCDFTRRTRDTRRAVNYHLDLLNYCHNTLWKNNPFVCDILLHIANIYKAYPVDTGGVIPKTYKEFSDHVLLMFGSQHPLLQGYY
jgi:hypothetical protein